MLQQILQQLRDRYSRAIPVPTGTSIADKWAELTGDPQLPTPLAVISVAGTAEVWILLPGGVAHSGLSTGSEILLEPDHG